MKNVLYRGCFWRSWHNNQSLKLRKEVDEMDKKLYIKQYGRKAYEDFCKKNRVVTAMNTGTRTMKTEKIYSRKRKHKKEWE